MGKEMTEEEKRKAWILNIENTISHYEKEALVEARERIAEARGKIDLLKGVIYGLVFGIFGNMVAQYFSSIVEEIVLASFGPLFVVNLGIFSISLSFVVVAAYNLKKTIARWEKYFWDMKDSERNLQSAIEDLRKTRGKLESDLISKEESSDSKKK